MTRRAKESERRTYIRLDTVFPVRFRVLDPAKGEFISDWLQGFTNNISKGGICLSFNKPQEQYVTLINSKNVELTIELEVPFSGRAVKSVCSIEWVRQDTQQERLFAGLCYRRIEAKDNAMLMRYARTKKILLPALLTVLCLVGTAFIAGSYINMRLIKGNKALINSLIALLQESGVAKQKIKEISREKEELQLKIQALQVGIQRVEEEKTTLETSNGHRMEELNQTVDRLSREKLSLQESLLGLQKKEDIVTEELLRLDKNKDAIEKENFDRMYEWLTVHQNTRTGLLISFEGDKSVADSSYIYDQSLAAQAFLIFSDLERAKRVLDFFARKAKRQDGFFYNAYYAGDGTPSEFNIHAGPNIWLGIACLRYAEKSGDKRYVRLAEEIAQAVLSLQDAQGGIKGGPQASWYSTEHNLDAYAFFSMLGRSLGSTFYEQKAQQVLQWLKSHTYDTNEVPVKRGKGDSTIATDTYAWSIAAIGPAKLFEAGLNPDDILSFAEKNCAVEVEYPRPEGRKVKVKGFDFAPQRNLARGGVVSVEWTAQMIISFSIMADYYHAKGMIAKARAYQRKASEYIGSLCSMIISSPSPSGQGQGCLPYASADSVDTGHGWSTPQGASTGSLSATAYTLFSYYNYNPLGQEKDKKTK